jgi:hypothetical protein
MDFIKFLVLSIAAFVLWISAGIYFDHPSADGFYHHNYVVDVVAVLVAGAVFYLLPPRHLKVGYAVWILTSIVLLIGLRLELEYEMRTYPDDDFQMAGVGVGFLWWASAIAVNPICYFAGKYLWKRFVDRRSGGMDGRGKPAHGEF